MQIIHQLWKIMQMDQSSAGYKEILIVAWETIMQIP